MKYELPCAVVRDLLPNYLEGLTSGETNQAVEAHLAACPDCAACKAAMAGGTSAAEAAEQAREVDYLKKVKRRSGRRILLAVLATVLLFVAGVAAKVFIIGQPVSIHDVMYTMTTDGKTLDIQLSSSGSATALKGWHITVEDDIAYVEGRNVLVSGLYRSGSTQVEVPLQGLSLVYLCGRPVWQDDTFITQEGLALYEARTPYVGDPSALNQIAELAHIRPNFGDYSSRLQTSDHPYRWTLDFSNDGWIGTIGRNPDSFDKGMAGYAIQLLALVENLEEVEWTYTDLHGEFQSQVLTLEGANALLPELFDTYKSTHAYCPWNPLPDVKLCGKNLGDFSKLLELTRISS